MPDLMKVNVLLFGRLADITGKGNISLENVADTNDVILQLRAIYPELAELNFLTAVEKELITENKKLEDNMTVALLPPFSGG
jgi:molybdopterin synthase sulfur carrier subunit